MADDTNPDDHYGDLGAGLAKGAASTATSLGANAQMQDALNQMLANYQARVGDYNNLGKAGYQDITAQQVGPSAYASITPDLQGRQAQQESIAALGDLSAHGGLNLADMNALNQIQGNLNRNNSARQQGLANQFAARGQLGSGAQLAEGLAAQQNAATNANQAGESAAAQAQQRALEAILQKGQAARAMGNDEYQRQADAARAKDAIEARNAAARTDAGKYNNTLRGADYANAFGQVQGKAGLTNGMNQTLLNKGIANSNTTKGIGEGINAGVNALNGATKGVGGGGANGGDGSNPDLTGDRGGASDLSGGTSLAGGDAGAGLDTIASDPSEWESFA